MKLINHEQFKNALEMEINNFIKNFNGYMSLDVRGTVEQIKLTVTNAKTGDELWLNMSSLVGNLPGFWSFFSDIRSLMLSIKTQLKLFPLVELLKSTINEQNEKMNEKHNELHHAIQENRALKEKVARIGIQVDKLSSTGVDTSKLQENVRVLDAAMREREKFLEVENAELKTTLAKVRSDNKQLVKKIEILETSVKSLIKTNEDLQFCNVVLQKRLTKSDQEYKEFKDNIVNEIHEVKKTMSEQKTKQEDQDKKIKVLQEEVKRKENEIEKIKAKNDTTILTQQPKPLPTPPNKKIANKKAPSFLGKNVPIASLSEHYVDNSKNVGYEINHSHS